LISIAADVDITEAVDIARGVHALIAKCELIPICTMAAPR
jgi:hypothetical protein